MFLADDLLAALPRLRRYARFLTDDPARADDIVEQTLTRARQPLSESPSSPTPYVRLLALMREVYAAESERGSAHASLPRNQNSQAHADHGSDASGGVSVARMDRSEAMLAELLRLPLQQREVMVLVAVERMSYEDIAALLRVPVATVMARLTQAREGLRVSAQRIAPKGAR